MFIDYNNPNNISAFSITNRSIPINTWITKEHKKTPLKSMIKSILYMIFTESFVSYNLNKNFKRRHKDHDKEIHLNETSTTFTVIDKTWAGKIAIGGHMRSGHWAIRYKGNRNNPTPSLVWIKPTTVKPYIKNAKKDII